MLSPRHRAILELCPQEQPIIDVGADHGLVASALGAIATERLPHRRSGPRGRWVIADGLRPFREVGAAIVAGMGANRIAEILEHGPRPRVAVLHAQDDPPRLRAWLAEHGWRIDAERLAPEARGYAEILRAIPGEEPATGLWLHYGPRLLDHGDPHLRAHLEQQLARHRAILSAVGESEPARSRTAEHVAFLAERLAAL